LSRFERSNTIAKKANTPKDSKPAGKAARTATNAAAGKRDRKRVTRENTNSRAEVRQQTVARKGHPK
jgi:hypothetical protein